MSQFGRTFQHLMDYAMRRFVLKKFANLWGDGRGHIKAQVHGKIDAWMGGQFTT